MAGAPEEHTVASVMAVSDEPWGDKKDMRTHEVSFENTAGEWKIYANVAWPVVIERGAVLKGWFNPDKKTFGLAKDHKGEDAPSSYTGPRRGKGGGGDSKNFDRRPEHPRNEARMIHTSSLSAAPKFIEQMLTVGVAAQPKDEDAYWALVGHVAGKLTKSYESPLSGTETPPAAPQQETLNGGGGEVPADTTDLQPVAVPPSDGDDIPF